ncbi:MAG: type II toxin-antitoxin system Phd/YefM family antitoxin [Gammaproteobacteria bacterium]|nr:type II toxin-antitoxin system Phd/YefM family antitoxin [Gammaproteobacteria bacterium]
MKMINIHEAKTHLSKIAESVAAGDEVIIAKAGKPMMKLTAYQQPPVKRRFGLLKGQIEISDDFDTALPDEVLDRFEGQD